MWKDGRGKILVAIACGWFLSIGVMSIYPVILPALRVSFDLDLTTAGLLVTVLWFVYGLGQLPAGLLADRFGEGTVMSLSTFFAGAAVVLVVLSTSRIMLYVATMILGLGTSLYGIARFTAMEHVFPERIGAANGIVDAAADVGNALLPVLAGIITGAVAWQYGLGFTVPLFLLTTVALWSIVPSRTGVESSAAALSLSNSRRLLTLMRRPALLYGTTVFLVSTSIWMTFMTFYPTYLIEQKGLSPSMASALFGLFFGLGIILKPITGVLYDRFGMRLTFILIILSAALGLIGLSVSEGFWLLLIITVLISSLNGYNPPLVSYLTTALPDEFVGTGLGLIRTITLTVSAVAPFLFGAIADQGLFDEVFLLLAGLMLLIMVPLSKTPE